MKVLLFGASGMVGQGALRECLLSPAVTEVVAVVRKPLGMSTPKLRELVHEDFFDWSAVEGEFAGVDACFFCLGISSVGMKEPEYRRTTYDLTLAAARVLLQQSSGAVFEYVSGHGTDASEKGSSMWARVKGETENTLRAMPFRAVYCFRPGYIQPMHGVRSKVGWYQAIYNVLSWTYPMLRRLFPKFVTSSEAVGRAMIAVAERGWPHAVLENRDIDAAAAAVSVVAGLA